MGEKGDFMNKQTIRVVAIIMMILVVFPLQMFAMAAQKDEFEPLWDNAMIVSCSISSGEVQTIVIAQPGVSEIKMDVYVYMLCGSSWIYVTENHKTVNGIMLTDVYNFTPVKNMSYKANFTIEIIRNGVSEVITQTKYYDN